MAKPGAISTRPGAMSLDLEEARKKWGLFIALGALLVALGIFAIIYSVATTLATVMIIGWTMAISGIVVVVHAFSVKGWAGTLVQLLGGILLTVFGLLVAFRPGIGAATLGLLIGAFFMAEGFYQLFVGISVRIRGRGWLIVSGIISIVLSFMVLSGWPASAFWVIGLLVGIDLVSNGALIMAFGWEARRLSRHLEVPQGAVRQPGAA